MVCCRCLATPLERVPTRHIAYANIVPAKSNLWSTCTKKGRPKACPEAMILSISSKSAKRFCVGQCVENEHFQQKCGAVLRRTMRPKRAFPAQVRSGF